MVLTGVNTGKMFSLLGMPKEASRSVSNATGDFEALEVLGKSSYVFLGEAKNNHGPPGFGSLELV